MTRQMMKEHQVSAERLRKMSLLVEGLVFYRGVLKDRVVQSFLKLAKHPDFKQYYRFFRLLAEIQPKMAVSGSDAQAGPWVEHLINLIISDDNPFSRWTELQGTEAVPDSWYEIAVRDLNILQVLASTKSETIRQVAANPVGGGNPAGEHVPNRESFFAELEPQNWPAWEVLGAHYPPAPREVSASSGFKTTYPAGTAWLDRCRSRVREALLGSGKWGQAVRALAGYYHQVGRGLLANYVAFRWVRSGNKGFLTGIRNHDPIELNQLFGYKRQREIIIENTEQFLRGHPAQNILLYGDRGTGKSSTVKALLNEYAFRGLRLVEVSKGDFGDFPRIARLLGEYPQRFVIFVDDLSFGEQDEGYKALKSVLEGTTEVKPENVVVYATSNRRHLVKESFSDRNPEDELHGMDTVQEKLSLADRFGITITFSSPSQEEYLQIVRGLARQQGLNMDPEELRALALRWAVWHNGMSGRTARQLVDYCRAKGVRGQDLV